MEKTDKLLKDSLKITCDGKHDHTDKGECLVMELENLCGEEHNNGEPGKDNCAECTAIKENL